MKEPKPPVLRAANISMAFAAGASGLSTGSGEVSGVAPGARFLVLRTSGPFLRVSSNESNVAAPASASAAFAALSAFSA